VWILFGNKKEKERDPENEVSGHVHGPLVFTAIAHPGARVHLQANRIHLVREGPA